MKEDYQTDTPYFHDWLKDSRNEQAAVLRLNIYAYDGEEHQNPPMYPSSEGIVILIASGAAIDLPQAWSM